MPYKKPDFIPDCIAEMTATAWGRLFTETPTYKQPASEKYRLGLKVGWPSAKPNNQEQLRQSLLEVWPNLFDDMKNSAVELEKLGRENYDAILELALCRKTPGDDLSRALVYATAMAGVIVAQRELLATVMPNIRKDTEHGYKMLTHMAETGRDRQLKRREKREPIWERWEQEFTAIQQRHPTRSQRSIAEAVARKCGGKADTIRRHMREKKKTSATDLE